MDTKLVPRQLFKEDETTLLPPKSDEYVTVLRKKNGSGVTFPMLWTIGNPGQPVKSLPLNRHRKKRGRGGKAGEQERGKM